VSDRYKEDVFKEEFFRGALASGGAFAVIDRIPAASSAPRVITAR